MIAGTFAVACAVKTAYAALGYLLAAVLDCSDGERVRWRTGQRPRAAVGEVFSAYLDIISWFSLRANWTHHLFQLASSSVMLDRIGERPYPFKKRLLCPHDQDGTIDHVAFSLAR